MKFNKWTLGLAAVGAVSLTSVAQAEEKMNVLQTAMTSTTISGYVDTSMQWNFGTGDNHLPTYAFGGSSKADGFNLNVVQLSIAKPLDESEWAAGYRADLWFGPDAATLATTSPFGTTSDVAIRQAYVALRTPVGNGIDWKIGVFDGIIGYETLTDGDNPNMTRSYGFTIEPKTQTGLLGTYRFCDVVTASFGVADTVGPTINARSFNGNPATANYSESEKTYTGSLAFTAPSNMGWLAGSTLYAGFIAGFSPTSTPNTTPFDPTTSGGIQNNYYIGTTLATPVAGLKVGAAIDYAHIRGGSGNVPGVVPILPAVGDQNVNNAYAYDLYVSYQATEKMSLHGRAEYYRATVVGGSAAAQKGNNEVTALTATIQYDLWQNVLSRLEIRWDHSEDPQYGNATLPANRLKNATMIAANFIYKF